MIFYLLLNAALEGKRLTQWAKNLSHWVTSFRRWVTFVSPSCSVKRCSAKDLTVLAAHPQVHPISHTCLCLPSYSYPLLLTPEGWKAE